MVPAFEAFSLACALWPNTKRRMTIDDQKLFKRLPTDEKRLILFSSHRRTPLTRNRYLSMPIAKLCREIKPYHAAAIAGLPYSINEGHAELRSILFAYKRLIEYEAKQAYALQVRGFAWPRLQPIVKRL